MPRTLRSLICATILSTMLVGVGADCAELPAHWKCEVRDGECIGKVRLTIRKAFWKEAVGEYVLSQFPNREYLFEDLTSKNVKKLLHLVNADTYAYFGTNGESESEALRDRYQHSVGQTVFSVVMGNLIEAFPEGEDEMPREWQTRSIEFEGKTFDVSAKKSGKKKFLFKVKERSQQSPRNWDVEGEWDVSKPGPWSDQTSMDAWTVQNEPSPSLKELRKGTP